VIDKFVNDYFPRAGYPECVLTDCGAEFLERDWEEFLTKVGVEHRQTMVRHPQSNGKVERMNRTIKETLRKLVNGDQTNWQEKLLAALTAVRTAPCASMGHSPFYLYHARRPRVPLSKFLDATCDQERVLGDRLANMSQALKEARAMTQLTRERNRTRLNDKANAQDIQVGDSVIVAANEPLSLTAKWDP
jgi:transposase InsO family protein